MEAPAGLQSTSDVNCRYWISRLCLGYLWFRIRMKQLQWREWKGGARDLERCKLKPPECEVEVRSTKNEREHARMLFMGLFTKLIWALNSGE